MKSISVFVQKDKEKSNDNINYYEIGIDTKSENLFNEFLVNIIKNLNPPKMYLIFNEMNYNLNTIKENLELLDVEYYISLNNNDPTFIVKLYNIEKLGCVLEDLLDSVMIGLTAFIILGENSELDKLLIKKAFPSNELSEKISQSNTRLCIYEQGISFITKDKNLISTKKLIDLFPQDITLDYFNTDL